MGRKRGVQYQPGGFLRSDDRSGFTERADKTKREWTGLIVAENLWEVRQPQDFVRGVSDPQSVPNARPIPPTIWDGPIYTTLALPALVGATFLFLNGSNGFSAGNQIGVMLETGVFFNTQQVGNATALGINLSSPLPAAAGKGNSVVDYGATGP